MGGDVITISPKCKKERREKSRCSFLGMLLFKYTKLFQSTGRRCSALTLVGYHSPAGLSGPLVQRPPLAAGALVDDRSDLVNNCHDVKPQHARD